MEWSVGGYLRAFSLNIVNMNFYWHRIEIHIQATSLPIAMSYPKEKRYINIYYYYHYYYDTSRVLIMIL